MPLAVAAVLGARSRLGLDLGDGTHAVALAVRLARGDQPFRDEMNLQVLGSWPALPFTWVWLHTVGLQGIVLASRLWFVAVALGAVAVSIAALSPLRRLDPVAGRLSIAVAASAAVVPMAYNLPVVSYNTTPALLYLIATSSTVGAVARSSSVSPAVTSPVGAGASAVGWAVLGGAAAVLGAVSHPVTAPAGATLLVIGLLVTRGRVRAALLAGAGGTVVVIAALLVTVWGVGDLRETLAFTSAYQSDRVDRMTRLTAWLGYLGGELREPLVVVALLLGAAAAVLLWRGRRTAGPLLVLGLVLAAAQGLTRSRTSATFSVEAWLSPVMAIVLLLVLLPAALVTAVRLQGSRRLLRPLLAAGVLPAVVGCLVVAAFTSSSPVWGAEGAVLAPAVLAVVLCSLVGLRLLPTPGTVAEVRPDTHPHASAASTASATAAGAVVVVALLASVVATSFRDGPLGRLTVAAPSGAYAGLLTSERRAGDVAAAQAAVRSCADPGAGVLAIGYPAAYLMGDVVAQTPVTWLGDFGPSTATVVQWLDRRGVRPDCVVHPSSGWPARAAGASPADDPLRALVERDYVPVPRVAPATDAADAPQGSGTSGLVVLRRQAP